VRSLAVDLGLDTVFVPADNPFGTLRNAVLTRLAVREVDAPRAGALSGDPRADDLTRLPVRLVLALDRVERDLTVVTQHLKSGSELDDRFRRAVDAQRTGQAVGASGPRVVLGDLNAEPEDMPESPARFRSLPEGLPWGYHLGADLAATLAGPGLANDAFAPLLDRGLAPVPAVQRDGQAATRPASGRQLDWIVVDADLLDHVQAEIYDAADEGLEGLPTPGPRPPPGACAQASDHLPVLADLVVGPP
jgi:endonuclease/exonuclease/phosphatase family metal-dependent hydrolase